jgi:hypothetical protein
MILITLMYLVMHNSTPLLLPRQVSFPISLNGGFINLLNLVETMLDALCPPLQLHSLLNKLFNYWLLKI